MGKQIAIAASHDDEKIFLEYVKSISEVKIIETFAESIDSLWKEQFETELYGHYHYSIWNTQFNWVPEYKQTIHGNFYVCNTNIAPIIKFSRSNLSNNQFGRIYWGKDFSAPDGLNYDIENFNKWYEQIVRWVKKNSPGKIRGGWITYCLPKAWEYLCDQSINTNKNL